MSAGVNVPDWVETCEEQPETTVETVAYGGRIAFFETAVETDTMWIQADSEAVLELEAVR